MTKYSLSDTPQPPLNHPVSTQSSPGRASPALHVHNGTSNGTPGTFGLQQQAFPPEQPRAGTAPKRLPKLRAEMDGEQDGDGSLVPGEHEEREEVTPAPLALPPMLLTEERETGFQDLLKLGTVHSTSGEKAKGKNMTKPGAPVRSEVVEAGPSKAPAPHVVIPSQPSNTRSPPPLTTLPVRKTSLSRKLSTRKPVPKAIVLPDSFEADMAFDMDESSGGPSSPRSFDRPEGLGRAPDSVGRSTRRPSSRDGPPPLSPRSKARQPSRPVQPGSPPSPDLDSTLATPMQSTSKPTVTRTDSGSGRTARPAAKRQDTAELVAKRIEEALANAQESGASTVRLDRGFLEVIHLVVQAGRDKLHDMRGKFDGMRVSWSCGLTLRCRV